MSAAGNFDLKEEIRDYWSGRAAGFDAAPGHRIDDADMAAWQRLIGAALGPLDGRAVLDGCSGLFTSPVGHGRKDIAEAVYKQLIELDFVSFAGQPWQGRLADAETLAGLPDAHFDAAVTRHLVWTLTEPASAFAAWFRVLKPGARLLVVDGDWVREGLRARLLRRIAAVLGGTVPAAADGAVHRQILSRVPYHDGLTRDRLIDDLTRAGSVYTEWRRLDGCAEPGLGVTNRQPLAAGQITRSAANQRSPASRTRPSSMIGASAQRSPRAEFVTFRLPSGVPRPRGSRATGEMMVMIRTLSAWMGCGSTRSMPRVRLASRSMP